MQGWIQGVQGSGHLPLKTILDPQNLSRPYVCVYTFIVASEQMLLKSFVVAPGEMHIGGGGGFVSRNPENLGIYFIQWLQDKRLREGGAHRNPENLNTCFHNGL